MVEFGFVERGFSEIVGLTHIDNLGSINVLRKLCFSYLRDEVTPMGMKAQRYVANKSIPLA